MKRATFSLLFYIKRTKLLKDGTAPIYLRITINGSRKELPIKRSISPKLWDKAKRQAKGNSEAARDLNDYLTSLRGQLFVHQRNIQEDGKPLTAESLVNAFLGKGEKQWGLLELFEQHNDQMNQLVGKEYSALTLQRYEAALKHVRAYIKMDYTASELALSRLDHRFVSGFEFYLKANGCQHNSAMKHMKALKKVIGIALKSEYMKKNPFANYQIKVKEVERECLTDHELELLRSTPMSIQRVDVIRDLFLFQCFTGLAYADLKALSPDHVHIGIDSRRWIYIKRGKTGNNCHIPILPVVEAIIRKYEDHPVCSRQRKLLPVPSNQKMNAYLKEVADLCGITKKLHTHLARHTYATTVTLGNGVSMEVVSKMLGHKKLQTTQIYAKVMDTQVSNEMLTIREKYVEGM